MNARRVLRTVVVIAAVVAAIGATTVITRAAENVLSAGTYTAKVKALVCRGCGPLVKKTMEGLKAIEAASVDQQTSTLEFKVKKDNSIKVSEIQTALKAAADKMGMGADYTLSDVKAKSSR
jgi:hypothetical protein